MADAVIGALRIVLGADTATFQSGLNDAESALSRFGKNVATIASGIGLERIIEKSISEVVFFIKDGVTHAIDNLEELGKASQKIGIPVEQLSELQYAANLADVSTQQLTSSMVRFSKSIAEAERGAITPAASAFEAMGVSINNADGSIKSNNNLLLDAADKFKNYEDGANKTALAIALFGKAGADLIPFLNQGREGIQKAGEEAQKFGVAVGDEAAVAAEKFNDNLKKLTAIVQGVFLQAVSQAAAELVIMSDSLVNVAGSAGIAQAAAKLVTNIISQLALSIVDTSAAIERVTINFTALEQAMKAQFGDIDALVKIWNESRAAIEEVNKRQDEQRNIIAGIIPFHIQLQTALKGVIELNDKLIDQFSKTAAPALAAKDSVDKYQKALSDFNAKSQELLGTTTGLADGFLKQAVQVGIMDTNTALATTSAANLTKQQSDLNDAMLRFEGARIIDQGRSAWEKYEIQLKKIGESQAAFANDTVNQEKLKQQALQLTTNAWLSQADFVASSWTQALTMIAKQNKDFAIAAKAAAIALAIINTAQGVTKALALEGPLAFLAIPAIIAAGAIQIATIAAQNFARGGSFKVGGGLTGMDSEMVAFRATPGEMVDIRRPGQTGGTGGVQTLVLEMPNPNEFFAVHVREMVNTLNRAAPDGYTLKVAK